MSTNFNYLLQTSRILKDNNYTESELSVVYEFLISLDDEILTDYNSICRVLTYNNDLELYIEIVEATIKIFEEKEEYEKCHLLNKKKEQANEIIKIKTI